MNQFYFESLSSCCVQLGVMTYGDVSKQSPETQAAIEQEVRALLKVRLRPLRRPDDPDAGLIPAVSPRRTRTNAPETS